MTKPETALREFVGMHKFGYQEYSDKILSDLTALISEHYVSKEEINQEVERRIAETVAGKFIAVEIEKRIADRFPGKEEILKYFNNHFNCYTDVTIRDYETTEIAMTNIAVLKMFEWLRSRLVSQKTDNLKENNNNGSTN